MLKGSQPLQIKALRKYYCCLSRGHASEREREFHCGIKRDSCLLYNDNTQYMPKREGGAGEFVVSVSEVEDT